MAGGSWCGPRGARAALACIHASARTLPPPPQVRIPAHCLTSNNRHVRARQLWGSDVYTEDSDLVAVLMHCGYWYHSRARQLPQYSGLPRVVSAALAGDRLWPCLLHSLACILHGCLLAWCRCLTAC